MRELESEREVLVKYQSLDRHRRTLEYAIFDRELREVRSKLEVLDAQRAEDSVRSASFHRDSTALLDQIHQSESRVKELTAEAERLSSERRRLDEDRERITQLRARLELDLADSEASVSEQQRRRSHTEAELRSLADTIASRSTALVAARERYQSLERAEQHAKDELAAAERTISELYAKQGRNSQFRSREERDAWIKRELGSVRGVLQQKRRLRTTLVAEIADQESQVQTCTRDVAAASPTLDERRTALEKIMAAIASLRKRRDELSSQRKEAWRRDADLEERLQLCRADFSRAERDLLGTVRREVAQGIASVEEVVRTESIPGVFGPLMELFECASANFATAAEVTAGASLFNIVVDSDETAARILDRMTRNRLPGRVTFMPLNRLSERPPRYPTTEDALPLIQQLQYEPRFGPAMMQIFGKTLVCRNLEVASQYARSENLDCITLDGDQVLRKGALRGGFIDVQRSRLSALHSKREVRHKLDTLNRESTSAKTVMHDADQRVGQLENELQRAESQRDQLRNDYEQLRQDVHALSERQTALGRSLETKRTQLTALDKDIERLDADVQRLSTELGTALESGLSADEQSELRRLNDRLGELKRDLASACEARAGASMEKTALENDLEHHLRKRQTELQASLDDVTTTERGHEAAMLREQLQSALAELDGLRKKLEATDRQLDSLRSQEHASAAGLEELRGRHRELSTQLQSGSKDLERLLSKRSMMQQKQEQLMQQIRDLGAVPGRLSEQQESASLATLYGMLRETNDELAELGHVNKKALDQYMTFSDQREQLLQRKGELDGGETAIRQLIEVLDQRKDEAIERTFKQVQAYFEEIFSELVPGGKAKLIMVRREAGAVAAAESDRAGPGSSGAGESMSARLRRGTIESFAGVSIKVAFHGRHGETHMIQQLSGGQKSVVALALIFAIQVCVARDAYLGCVRVCV
jgi:structural maintenance of chromosome 3 (chondroitin sulfate proteoglycan 6)